jgi:hypothetical protein
MSYPTERYLRRIEAAEYLHNRYGFCSPKSLAKYATLGGGPAYRLVGRFPVYKTEDLDSWALSKLSRLVHSSNEYEAT